MNLETTTIMTLLDVVNVCLAVSGVLIVRRVRRELDPAHAAFGPGVISGALVILGLYHLTDLFAIHALPLLTSPAAAAELSDQLHYGSGIVSVLFAVMVVTGLILSTRTMTAAQRALRASQASYA